MSCVPMLVVRALSRVNVIGSSNRSATGSLGRVSRAQDDGVTRTWRPDALAVMMLASRRDQKTLRRGSWYVPVTSCLKASVVCTPSPVRPTFRAVTALMLRDACVYSFLAPQKEEEDEKAAAEARRAEEQVKLEAEAEKRRKRIEAWQAQRRKVRSRPLRDFLDARSAKRESPRFA